MKKVQIDYELFRKLIFYHLGSDDQYEEDIRNGLEEKLDALVSHSLYGWLGIIQSLSLGNGICQISSDVCPADCAFGIWNFIVSTIAITHQITFEVRTQR